MADATCKRGHPRTPENTYGYRECLPCKRLLRRGAAPPVAYVCARCGIVVPSRPGARLRKVCELCEDWPLSRLPQPRRKPRHIIIQCVICGASVPKLRRSALRHGVRTCSQPCAYKLGMVGATCSLDDAPVRRERRSSCDWCGGLLPEGRKRWCNDVCMRRGIYTYQKAHTECVVCGAALGRKNKFCAGCGPEVPSMRNVWGEVWQQAMADPVLRGVSQSYLGLKREARKWVN